MRRIGRKADTPEVLGQAIHEMCSQMNELFQSHTNYLFTGEAHLSSVYYSNILTHERSHHLVYGYI